MSKRLLLGIIIVLLITNIATLLFWSADKYVVVDSNGEDRKINSKKPAAMVDGTKISYNEWMTSLRENNGEKHLKTMIGQSVVKQLARQKNIKVDEKVIDREVALLTSTQGVMTEEETNRKEEKWREAITYRYQLEALLTEDVDISADAISKYYEAYHKQYDFKASRQFSHIVVENNETAEKIMKELDQGASFHLLAQEYSIDEETKNDGGYLGFFVKESSFLPSEYDEKGDELEERTYSNPFKSQDGITILYLHRSLPSITFTYDEIKPYIKNELALDKLDQSLTADTLWDELDIEWVYE